MKIGVWELLVVFIVALIVIGPDKLPEYAKKLGEALRQFKKYSSEVSKDIRESVVEPLQEAQKPIKEAMEPVTDLEKSVRGDINDLKKSFKDIGKTPAAKTTAEEAVSETAPETTADEAPSQTDGTAESAGGAGGKADGVTNAAVSAASEDIEVTEDGDVSHTAKASDDLRNLAEQETSI